MQQTHRKGSTDYSSAVIRLHVLAGQPMLCPAAGSSAWDLVEAGGCVVSSRMFLCVQRGWDRGVRRMMSEVMQLLQHGVHSEVTCRCKRDVGSVFDANNVRSSF